MKSLEIITINILNSRGGGRCGRWGGEDYCGVMSYGADETTSARRCGGTVQGWQTWSRVEDRRRGHILINLWMKLCWRACHVGAVLWRRSWRLTTGTSLVSVLCGYMEVGIYRDERCSFGINLQLLQEHLNPGWALHGHFQVNGKSFLYEGKMGKAFSLNAFNWCNWVSYMRFNHWDVLQSFIQRD